MIRGLKLAHCDVVVGQKQSKVVHDPIRMQVLCGSTKDYLLCSVLILLLLLSFLALIGRQSNNLLFSIFPLPSFFLSHFCFFSVVSSVGKVPG